jgi:hypothetical protein
LRLWVCDDRRPKESKMHLHANAKLGLYGGYALVTADEGGCSLKGRGRLQRLAGDHR